MKIIKAEVITIGDEILIGQITDTNTQWLGAQLSEIGIKTVRKSSIGDEASEIISILTEATKRTDILILTGGLGPTKDDITKHTLCKFLGVDLELHIPTLDHVMALFESRGRIISEVNKQQAMLPKGAEVLKNKLGTAPGMWMKYNDCIIISLPGVPYEMKGIMTNEGFPKLKSTFKTPFIVHKNIMTIGKGESALAEMIAEWETALPSHLKLAYLPAPNTVRLRISGIGENETILKQEIEEQVQKVLPLIAHYVYGFDEQTIEQAVGEILKLKKLSIATAESCTGGLTAHLITSVAGSSAYYKGSIVAYANEVKIDQLGVSANTLENYGAVSEQTVKEMAEGVRKKLGTDIGIASSGIAGPDGGTQEKPVGTIWIAYADAHKTEARLLQLSKVRELNIKMTAQAMLNLVRRQLS